MTTTIDGSKADSPGYYVGGVAAKLLVQSLRNENKLGTASAGVITVAAVPAVANGVQILATSITPKKIGSLIVVDWSVLYVGDAQDWVSTHAFAGSTFLGQTAFYTPAAGYGFTGRQSAEFVSTSLDPISIQVRIGSNTGTTWRLNGNSNGAFYGGNAVSYLNVKEFA